MICHICQKEFVSKHFNQKLCSVECKKEATKQVKKRYKQTEKGKQSYERWCANPIKKIIDKNYRQTDNARRISVIRTKRFYERHPDAKVYHQRLYGFRRRGYNAGRFDKKEWDNKLLELKGLCQMCKTDKNITIDHIKPLSKGGTNHIDNLQPLCRSCNTKKYNFYE